LVDVRERATSDMLEVSVDLDANTMPRSGLGREHERSTIRTRALPDSSVVLQVQIRWTIEMQEEWYLKILIAILILVVSPSFRQSWWCIDGITRDAT